MTPQVELLALKGAVSEMPEEAQQKVAEAANQFRQLVSSDEGMIATALVLAEIAAKEGVKA